MADKRLEIALVAKDMSAKAFNHLRGHLARLKKQVFSVNTALGAMAGAAGLGYAIKKNLEFADSIAKTADRIGISTEALQKYRYVAERSGVEMSSLDKGLEAFTKRLGEMRAGTGALNAYLAKLDENFRDQVASAGSVDEALQLVYRRMNDMTDASERAALGAAAFSRTAGVKMTLMAKDVDHLAKRFEFLGLAIDEKFLRQSEGALDAITDLERTIKTNLTQTLLALAPTITSIAEGMTNWVTANKELIQSDLKSWLEGIRDVMADIAKYARLRSVSGTFRQGLDLAEKGLIDFKEFKAASFMERQKMVDAILNAKRGVSGRGTSFGPLSHLDELLQMPGYSAGYRSLLLEQPYNRVNIGKPGDTTGLGLLGPDSYMEYPEPPIKEWGESFRAEFSDVAYGMHRALSDGFINPMSDSFLELEELGKRTFSAIADHVINNVSGMIVDSLFGTMGGGSGGGIGMVTGFLADLFHKGGTVGGATRQRAVSPAMFIGAPRLHMGTDEYPAILQRGETVIPKGAGIAPKMELHLHNEGQPLKAEMGAPRFDGEKWVQNVILKSLSQGGSFSKNLKAALDRR